MQERRSKTVWTTETLYQQRPEKWITNAVYADTLIVFARSTTTGAHAFYSSRQPIPEL
jgi:alkylation response protein AidB-like acyl-CoA dehydrogenase